MSTRIKICGLTRAEDARVAAGLGVHAIGLMFYPKSPRRVSLETAVAIRRELPPFVSAVALFLDAAADEVRQVMESVKPDFLQFHGSESQPFCASFGLPYIKAIPMAEIEATKMAGEYSDASALLLDSHAKGAAGGSGKAFDWSLVPHNLGRPVVLAGGLNPQNVEQAVRQVRPYAVDVSSGVESAPGVKDANLIAEFVKGVRLADSHV
jgi:phosphoribosylanthranilate isomerase